MAAKYYVFNKEMDYRRGYMQGLKCGGDGLRPDMSGTGYGVFISRLLDGLEDGCAWHRLTLKLRGGHEGPFRLSFYASDSPVIFNGDQPVDISEQLLLPASVMDVAEKKQLFAPYLMLEVENGTDILLHQVRGRYMWFMAELYGFGDTDTGIGELMVYFPEQSWLNYLPEVYDRREAGDTFLNRYLAIFQSLYDDMSKEIEGIPGCLDPEAADEETLRWLADWLGIHQTKIWSGEKLRFLVSHAPQLYRRRGTKQGIAAFVRLYTGEQPLIVEPHQLERFSGDPQMYKLLRELYGTEPNVFLIIIQASCLPTAREFADLQKIIEDVKPAWMEFRLVTLRPYILLDSYSYLGINSVLSQYRSFELNGFSMLNFATVGESAGMQI